MKCRGLAVVLTMALVACGDKADKPDQAVRETTRPVPCSLASVRVDPEPIAKQTILAFGDSLFAGYGLCDDQGYPERLRIALEERHVDAAVIDAGVSGDTSAAGLQRIGFVLDAQDAPPDLVIVELGGNDLLRGIPPNETRNNLAAILTELRKRKIPVLLMGMRAPPNLGETYVAEFDAIYPALAKRFGTALVPFFLEPVYDKPALIQRDRIHPTAEGVEALVEATVDDVEKALPDQ